MSGGDQAVGVLDGPAGPNAPVGPDAGVMAIMATTRAMRYLRPDPVPDELLRSVIEAATWAPSGGNVQSGAYVVVTGRETMGRLAGLWQRVIDDYRVVMAAAGVDAGSDPVRARIVASVEFQSEHFAEIPALIVVCQDERAVRAGRRSDAAIVRILIRRVGLRRALSLVRVWPPFARRSEAASIYPAVQNLLLAARAHGLGACLTTWHLLAEDEFRAIVGIPNHVTTWAVVPIGWPLRPFGPVRRRPVDEAIHRERW